MEHARSIRLQSGAAERPFAPARDVPTEWLCRLRSTLDWQIYFERHVQLSPRDVGEVGTLDPRARTAIVRSLRRFQIGESHGSRIAADVWIARNAFLDDPLRHAITAYIAEEHRHGDLLLELLGRLGAQPSDHDLSASAFKVVRRLLGLRAKIVALNAAEIIGAVFYTSIVGHCDDPMICKVVASIRDDELAHLAFGVMTIRRMINAPGGQLKRVVRRAALAGWLHVVVLGALALVVVDHAPYLRRAGFRTVVRPTWSRLRWFSRALADP